MTNAFAIIQFFFITWTLSSHWLESLKGNHALNVILTFFLLLLELLPHRVEGVGLGELNNDGTRPKLMAGVARVPVVVGRVAVEKSIARTTNAFDDDC